VPAPAVIPAPKAYINAVAVKGFVVELWIVKETRQSHPPRIGDPVLLRFVNIRNKDHGSGSLRFRMSCMQEGARDFLL